MICIILNFRTRKHMYINYITLIRKFNHFSLCLVSLPQIVEFYNIKDSNYLLSVITSYSCLSIPMSTPFMSYNNYIFYILLAGAPIVYNGYEGNVRNSPKLLWMLSSLFLLTFRRVSVGQN